MQLQDTNKLGFFFHGTTAGNSVFFRNNIVNSGQDILKELGDLGNYIQHDLSLFYSFRKFDNINLYTIIRPIFDATGTHGRAGGYLAVSMAFSHNFKFNNSYLLDILNEFLKKVWAQKIKNPQQHPQIDINKELVEEEFLEYINKYKEFLHLLPAFNTFKNHALVHNSPNEDIYIKYANEEELKVLIDECARKDLSYRHIFLMSSENAEKLPQITFSTLPEPKKDICLTIFLNDAKSKNNLPNVAVKIIASNGFEYNKTVNGNQEIFLSPDIERFNVSYSKDGYETIESTIIVKERLIKDQNKIVEKIIMSQKGRKFDPPNVIWDPPNGPGPVTEVEILKRANDDLKRENEKLNQQLQSLKFVNHEKSKKRYFIRLFLFCITFLGLLISLGFNYLLSQEKKALYTKAIYAGDDYFNKANYSEAIGYYQFALDNNVDNNVAEEKLNAARRARDSKQPPKPNASPEPTENVKVKVKKYIKEGDDLVKQKKYDDALTAYENAKVLDPQSKTIDAKIQDVKNKKNKDQELEDNPNPAKKEPDEAPKDLKSDKKNQDDPKLTPWDRIPYKNTDEFLENIIRGQPAPSYTKKITSSKALLTDKESFNNFINRLEDSGDKKAIAWANVLKEHTDFIKYR
jgi:hypothetical protein